MLETNQFWIYYCIGDFRLHCQWVTMRLVKVHEVLQNLLYSLAWKNPMQSRTTRQISLISKSCEAVTLVIHKYWLTNDLPRIQQRHSSCFGKILDSKGTYVPISPSPNYFLSAWREGQIFWFLVLCHCPAGWLLAPLPPPLQSPFSLSSDTDGYRLNRFIIKCITYATIDIRQLFTS